MLVREIMTKMPEAIPGNASVAEAAQMMETLDLGFIPIVDENKTAGVVTDRDIALRAVAKGLDCNETPVKSIMSTGIACVSENDDVQRVAEMMKSRRVRRLLVENDKRQISGVLSFADLAVQAHEPELVADAIEELSKPAMPVR